MVRDVLPDQVPIHFNIKGEADDWGLKWVNAIALPLLGIGLYLLLVAVDPLTLKIRLKISQIILEVYALLGP